MNGSRRVMLVAGEASGDQHAAGLVREARARDPRLEFFGVGGDSLRAAGAAILHPSQALSIVGISEVVSQLPTVLAILRDLRARLRTERPAALLLVDLPDFNLALAKTARALGIPVVYFISPQVWAWRRGRIETIRRRVDRMIVFFPFEESFYRGERVPVTLAGHPLAELVGNAPDRRAARQQLGLDPLRPTFGLLPGSRGGELRRHLEPMLETARQVLVREPEAQFVLPIAHTLDPEPVQRAVLGSGLPVIALRAAFERLVQACEAAVCASGTATLELAAQHVPAVVVYRTSWITYLIGRLVVRVPYVSLVNLIAEEPLLPELLQHRFTAAAAADELLGLAAPGPRRERVLAGIERVCARLGPAGAYGRAAGALLDVLDGGALRRGES